MIRFLSQINRLKGVVDLSFQIGRAPLPTAIKDRCSAFAYSISVDLVKKNNPEEFQKVSMEIIDNMEGKPFEEVALETSTKLAKLVNEKLGTDGLKKLIEKIEKAVEDFYD